MKSAVILAALAVGYFSLGAISPFAVGQTTDAEPTVAADAEAQAEAEQNGKAKEDKKSKEKIKNKDDQSADKKSAEEKPADKKKRQTAKAEEKRLRVVVTLDGTFTAEKMTPVALRPKEWSQFKIEEIVKHGSEVHAGETLVKFDREKFDEELADLELGLHVSELAIRKAEEELPRIEKTLALAATQAERNDKHAQEDYDRFHKIDRPLLLKSIEYQLKSAQFQLDYQQDELSQLEKMYEADDLTEETEEIVLKRSRTQVEFAKFSLERTKIAAEEMLQILLPRFEIEIKESLDTAALAKAQAKTALALDINRARYELEQLKQTRAKSVERHAKLLSDKSLLELKAPADGIVYYGECDDGNWNDMASLIAKLKPHASATADTVLMTIVERRPLEVLAQVGEAQRPEISVGRKAKVVPPLENAEWLAAKVESVSAVPVATGKFSVAFDLAGTELPEWIVPGMSCKVKVMTFDKDDALVLPKKAVHTDKDDEELKYVWLVQAKGKDADAKDAKVERRVVKLGRTSGDNIEITDGLEKGDVVSLDDEEKAAEKKDDAE
jgi:multidrug efflux pump subunit AcrA (membrane-fusion protein)